MLSTRCSDLHHAANVLRSQHVVKDRSFQPVEFLQRGERRQVVEVEVAEFVHDGVLFRGEEGV